MTALPHHGEVRCIFCGAILAHDHHDTVVCSPCVVQRAAYNPFHDAGLPARLLAVLQLHRNEPVNVYRELGIESCGSMAWICVQNHIRRFRRHGHVIVGGHGTYEYRGQMPASGARKDGEDGRP